MPQRNAQLSEYANLLQEEHFMNKRAVKIYMPDRLKSLLVDDWENITKNLQLVQLPSSEPAGVILDKYQEWALSTGNKNSTERDILEEVVAGLKEYFNKSLGRLLLYRFEREHSTISILASNSLPTSLPARQWPKSTAVNICFAFSVRPIV
jgi:hypothetical protein